jgi:hypothetical protein
MDIAKRLLPNTIRRTAREYQVSRSIRHLSGPRRISFGEDEAVVTCVLRNGEYYVDEFIQHYLRMGFRHIFLLDNGSTDRTVDLAAKHSQVTLFQSTLPIHGRQGLFKKYLATRCVAQGWCLDVDVDEFFEYPLSSRLSLCGLLTYFNNRNFTIMLTYMLDMVSAGRPVASPVVSNKWLRAAYEYYDISDIRRVPYRDDEISKCYGMNNILPDGGGELYFGGIRKKLFGSRFRDCLLTKHSLFKTSCGLDLFRHVHFVDGGRIADVSGVLLHYKLTDNALACAEQNRDRFKQNAEYYEDMIRVLRADTQRESVNDATVRLRSIDQLVDSGFLFASDVYRSHTTQ